jgi:hypothetical protein
MSISNELLDDLLQACKRPEDLPGDTGLIKELKVRLIELMLGAELTAHLGYEAGGEPPPDQTHHRNGVTAKRVKGLDGEVPLGMPPGLNDSSRQHEVGHATRCVQLNACPSVPDAGNAEYDGVMPRVVENHLTAAAIDPSFLSTAHGADALVGKELLIVFLNVQHGLPLSTNRETDQSSGGCCRSLPSNEDHGIAGFFSIKKLRSKEYNES